MGKNEAISGILLLVLAGSLRAQSLDIIIRNIRSEKGEIQLSFFADQKSFETNSPLMTNRYNKTTLTDGTLHLVIELTNGVYGIALLDDENGNGEMDYNTLGIPREGFGFSNYDKVIRRRPHFSEFQIQLGDDRQYIEIKVNYR